jgi:hypothetical protein
VETLATWAYIATMGNELQDFSGTVLRVEPDGFGIVKFTTPVGANTHGVFSTAVSSTLPPLSLLKPHVKVVGTAITSSSDFATVTSLNVVVHKH